MSAVAQYASGSCHALLKARGMRRSMGRKGCCYDNAVRAGGARRRLAAHLHGLLATVQRKNG